MHTCAKVNTKDKMLARALAAIDRTSGGLLEPWMDEEWVELHQVSLGL